MNRTVNIIGAGLAGCEAAWQLSRRGIKVNLYDIKPQEFTPAHSSENFCELVCSNSLKSNDTANAHGLLKQEMRELNSLIIDCADKCAVPAGSALAVDREAFSKLVTDKLNSEENINIICREVTDIDIDNITVIATGPLTTPKLSAACKVCGGEKPVFFCWRGAGNRGESIDFKNAFSGSRYGKNSGDSGDYINCPLGRQQYYDFVSELASAKSVQLKDFEDNKVFEGCLPIEIVAKRGADTLRYGALKPVGLKDKDGNTPFAAVQLRGKCRGKLLQHGGFQQICFFGAEKGFFQ